MSAKADVLPTPDSIAKYVKQNLQKTKKAMPMMAMMHHEGGQEVVRKDDYKGHHIEVRTTYHITVDGNEVTGHLMLTNSGQVQYHGMPNYSFDSAIQLVRALIDNFPEDFEKSKSSGSGGMSGMKMKSGSKSGGMAGMHMAGGSMGKMKSSKQTKSAGKKPAKSGKTARKSK